MSTARPPTLPTLATSLAALALLAAPALADDKPHCFAGYAYHLDSGEYAYSEHHEQQIVDGDIKSWKVSYRGPDGKVIADKTLEFGASDFVPTYRMQIKASGYVEGIRKQGSQWQMIRRETAGEKMQTENFELKEQMAGDSGFHPYVQAHFEELVDGDTVKFHFAVAGRQSVIKMKAKRIDDSQFENRQTVRFRTELDMFLVNYLVDPLVLDYDPESRELLEYRGIGNMHNEQGKPYPVRVSYYSEKPEQAKNVSTDCGGGT